MKRQDDDDHHDGKDAEASSTRHVGTIDVEVMEQEYQSRLFVLTTTQDDEETRYHLEANSSTNVHEKQGLVEKDNDDGGSGDKGVDTSDEKEKKKMSSPPSLKRLSSRLSESIYKRSSSVAEQLPETPVGWVVFLSTLGSALLGYEIQLQQSLTGPPLVFGQQLQLRHDGESNNRNDNLESSAQTPLQQIYQSLTATPQSILRRDIAPSLFVGTRGVISSTASYFMGGPGRSAQHLRFREIMHMTQDGAEIAIDWELPVASTTIEMNKTTTTTSSTTRDSFQQKQKQDILQGPILQPVVLVLHGINNDASFGYVKSLMRACCDRGWVAAGMNFRGCGGVPMTTPRGYNGAYTGDIRCVVQRICARLHGDQAYLFLVGNSLGANLITKYLGEEGLSGTLPSRVAGGVSLGNPMSINSGNMNYLLSPIMALGIKKYLLENGAAFWPMVRLDANFRRHIIKALSAVTLGEFDDSAAPIFARNAPRSPFSFRIGYKNGQAYWTDASSYRLIRYASVPILQIMAADDMLCYNPFRGTFTYSLANPNVMIVETRCGGHLGWQESPPQDSRVIFSAVTSWSDVATTDFIQAVLQTKTQQQQQRAARHTDDHSLISKNANGSTTANASPSSVKRTVASPPIRSKL